MKSLKHIRVAVSLVMLLEGCMWVLLGVSAPQHTRVVPFVQVVPSLLGATLGAGLFWLLITFFFGRIYCSSVCPMGTVQDCLIRLRRFVPGLSRKRFSYKPATRMRYGTLCAYIVLMVAGIGFIPLLLEPWPAFVNWFGVLTGGGVHPYLEYLGAGAVMGLLCAIVSALAVAVYSMFRGRDYCNDICPLGTVLRGIGGKAAVHIELDPDRCTACLKCEDVCKASCIDIKGRVVDNGRCVRCFNCINVCEDDAIHYTIDRNGVLTGLFQRQTSVN